MRLVAAVVLAAFAALAAHADTGALRQNQLEFLDVSATASGGATAKRVQVAASDKEALFQSLDINGDGLVSKAEAAGNAPVTLGFDRADRNKDGKLSRAEYDSIGKPPVKTAKAGKARQARNPDGSPSAGGTKAKEKK